MKKYLFITFAIAAFMFVTAESSLACSCMVTDAPLKEQVENAYNDASAVFSGEVVEVIQPTGDSYDLTVKIKVAKSWKGGTHELITITTGKDSAMCGFNFEVGKTYLVYAHGDAAKLSTTICSRTAVFDKKGDATHLKKLKTKKKSKSA